MAVTFPVVRMVINDQSVEFADADILECTVLQECHPLSIELPASTADVTVYTNDNRFSIYSDGEFYNALSKNMPVEIYEKIDSVEIFIGKFYLDKWDAPTENTLHFELVDAIGLLGTIEYPGSFWEVATSFYEVVADVMKATNIPVILSSSVRLTPIKGWIPPGTVREALQQLCFAAKAAVKTDGLTALRIQKSALPPAPLFYYLITDAEKTGEQRVVHLPLVTDIAVKSHDYYNLGTAYQTAEEIFSSWLEPGNYIVSYQKPYWKVWGTGVGAMPIYTATEDGRVIVTEDSGNTWLDAKVATESETFEFHSNYVSIHVTTAGQITVWGYPWLVNERYHRYSSGASVEKNAIIIDDAMLVSSDTAEDVLAGIVEYYNLRYRKEVKLFPRKIPLSELFEVDSLHGKKFLGISQKLQSDLSGGYLVSATFAGSEKMV